MALEDEEDGEEEEGDSIEDSNSEQGFKEEEAGKAKVSVLSTFWNFQ